MTHQFVAIALALCIPLSASADSEPVTNKVYLHKAVHFDYGKTRVRSAQQATLVAVARLWKANAVPTRITLEGHGYAVEEEASIELGYQRAERVRKFLVAQGVDERYIDAVGHSRGEIGRYVDIVFEPSPRH